jgi:hypothetical protein
MVHWWGRGERGGEGRELIVESGSRVLKFQQPTPLHISYEFAMNKELGPHSL